MKIWLSKQFELEEWRRRMVFWGGAVATGAAAVLFAKGSDFAMALFFKARAWATWWPYVSAPVGLGLCAWLTRRVFVGAEGSGIPQTMAALAMPTEDARDRVLSIKIATGKILLTLLGLASGGSLGREGPTVQVGASIMHSLRRFARFSATDVDRGLILAGGAAGVAAAFNTPLAGIVFAIEELSRSFEERTSGTILTAVIVAGVTSLALVGNYTYFGTTSAFMSEPRMWLAVPICGINAWKSAQSDGSATALQAFLQNYPQGVDADQARKKLMTLNSSYRAELGTFHDKRAAERKRSEMKSRFSSVLKEVDVLSPDSSSKRYRVMSGLMDRHDAASACASLKRGHQSCEVVRADQQQS